MAKSIRDIGTRLFAVGAMFAAPLAAVVKIAGDATEAANKFTQVFGSEAKRSAAFVDELAKSVGRSKVEIMDGMSAFQAFFVGLGFAPEKAREMSQALEQLSIDFGSFHNISDQESMERFISALSGSSEVLDRFGVNIKASALNQELLRMGIKKTTANATEVEKVLARMNIMFRALGDQGAVGDAVRTAGSFSNQLKRLRGVAMDAAAAIGDALIPAVTPIIIKLGDIVKTIAEWTKENGSLTLSLAKVVTGAMAIGGAMMLAAGAIRTVAFVINAYRTATKAAAAAQAALLALSGPKGWAMLAGGVAIAAAAVWGLGKILDGVAAEADQAVAAAAKPMDAAGAAADRAAPKIRNLFRQVNQLAAHPMIEIQMRIPNQLTNMERAIAFAARAGEAELLKMFEGALRPAEKLNLELRKLELIRNSFGDLVKNSPLLRQAFLDLEKNAVNAATGIFDQMQELRDELAMLRGEATKSSIELAKMGRAGVPPETLRQFAELQQAVEDAQRAQDRKEQHKKDREAELEQMLADAKAVRESVMTPEEKAAAETQRLQQLHATPTFTGAPLIDAETTARAILANLAENHTPIEEQKIGAAKSAKGRRGAEFQVDSARLQRLFQKGLIDADVFDLAKRKLAADKLQQAVGATQQQADGNAALEVSSSEAQRAMIAALTGQQDDSQAAIAKNTAAAASHLDFLRRSQQKNNRKQPLEVVAEDA